ncbi:MAG: hypothetical protein AAGA08_17045 [Pseudomonadota bacterium]
MTREEIEELQRVSFGGNRREPMGVKAELVFELTSLALKAKELQWQSLNEFERSTGSPDDWDRAGWQIAEVTVVGGSRKVVLPITYRTHPEFDWFVLDSGKPCKVHRIFQRPLPTPGDAS